MLRGCMPCLATVLSDMYLIQLMLLRFHCSVNGQTDRQLFFPSSARAVLQVANQNMVSFKTCISWLAILSLVSFGCGTGAPKGVIVKGKVLKGDAPMPVERPEIRLGMVELQLVPDSG